ncbi:zf-HC2 domain-containing protein [Anaeromyxobacter sp. Fw109-5]|uniref:zf-HC2 domain-containing protein n=1 Tax=Anaeromyxobacter sp. (strain Fw109-5) TaxID=404589 RepID=UPI000158A81D|nr:zf-HC2 domain-containing protein [Anaeromyxobacter sp. Fw109-5]ABS28154.1 hypothetical protein Anae109_3976 [Anaeromyxobacter sp. Fw109-5]
MTPASACSDYDLLLSLHAANALRGDDRDRLEAHLARCPECRGALEETAELLRLTRLPAPTPVERRVFSSLPERTVEAVRQGERRRGVVRRIALAMGAVAALSLVPLVMRDAPPEVGDPGSWFDRLTTSGRSRGLTTSGRSGGLTASGASETLDAAGEPDALVDPRAARRVRESSGGGHPQLASASPQLPVQAASWEEPDPDQLWEDSSVLQALGELEEMAFAAEAAVQ